MVSEKPEKMQRVQSDRELGDHVTESLIIHTKDFEVGSEEAVGRIWAEDLLHDLTYM